MTNDAKQPVHSTNPNPTNPDSPINEHGAYEKVENQTGEGEQSPGTIPFHQGSVNQGRPVVSQNTARTIKNGKDAMISDEELERRKEAGELSDDRTDREKEIDAMHEKEERVKSGEEDGKPEQGDPRTGKTKNKEAADARDAQDRAENEENTSR